MKMTFPGTGLKYLIIGGLLAVLAATASGATAQRPRISAEITSAQQTTLKNSLHPMAQAEFDAGRVASDTRLEGITLMFNRSAAQEAALQALLVAQQDPTSPQYHRWLTPDQFAAQFGMSSSDLTKAQTWLQQQGFTIQRVTRSKNAIRFSGTVRQVEQAFSTEMHYYKVNGTEHFAPSTALSVPAALAPTLQAVRNLDNFRPHSHVITVKNGRVRPNFTSSQSGNVFFAPGDIATVYDVMPLYNASITGTGQAIAIVGQTAVLNSDIEAFESANSLPTKDPNMILVPDTGASAVNPFGAGDEVESDLDIEWAGGIAPGATIQFVYTGNSQNSSGAFDALIYAIDQNVAPIVSASYGTCETALGTFSLESTLQQAAAQGQTVIAASGDDGSTDCYGITGLSTTQQQALAVDYPASSQYVTGVGGTEVSQANSGQYLTAGDGYWAAQSGADQVSSALQYMPEVVWNDETSSCNQSGCLSAGGGGASALYPKPTWQTGVPGIPTDSKRDVPDVALFASPDVPGFLFCTSDSSNWQTNQTSSCTSGFRDSSSGLLTVAGGTSFAAPIFAGMTALVNEKAGYTEGQGQINPTLYTLAANAGHYASAFHDVTSGNNDCNAGTTLCPSKIGFSAATGYDQVTGLGSVDLTNLAAIWPLNSNAAVAALINTTMTVTPATNSPTVGANDIFTIAVASTSGTSVPSGSITITIDGSTSTATTATLAGGTYSFTTAFANTGTHVVFVKYAGDGTHAPSSNSATINVYPFLLSFSPTTLTVAQGSSGTDTVTVTPNSGYTGTVNLTVTVPSALDNLCGGFSTTTGAVTISGTAAVTNTLTLDTKASDCSSNSQTRKTGLTPMRLLSGGQTARNELPSQPARLPMSLAFTGIFLAGLIGRRSRKLRGLAAILLLAAAGLALTACGSSTTTTTTVQNPPKGTYTITVTGTDSASSAKTNTATFTFVID